MEAAKQPCWRAVQLLFDISQVQHASSQARKPGVGCSSKPSADLDYTWCNRHVWTDQVVGHSFSPDESLLALVGDSLGLSVHFKLYSVETGRCCSSWKVPVHSHLAMCLPSHYWPIRKILGPLVVAKRPTASLRPDTAAVNTPGLLCRLLQSCSLLARWVSVHEPELLQPVQWSDSRSGLLVTNACHQQRSPHVVSFGPGHLATAEVRR